MAILSRLLITYMIYALKKENTVVVKNYFKDKKSKSKWKWINFDSDLF